MNLDSRAGDIPQVKEPTEAVAIIIVLSDSFTSSLLIISCLLLPTSRMPFRDYETLPSALSRPWIIIREPFLTPFVMGPSFETKRSVLLGSKFGYSFPKRSPQVVCSVNLIVIISSSDILCNLQNNFIASNLPVASKP